MQQDGVHAAEGGVADPLGVRADARFVAGHSDYVSIDEAAIDALCGRLAPGGALALPEWETGYHFVDGGERTVAYIFVLDTLNFCFWGDPKWRRPHGDRWLDGYWALAAALTETMHRDPGFFRAEALAAVSAGALRRVLGGEPEIPLLEQRARNLRELGRWVAADFEGRYADVVEEAGFDAIALAGLLVSALDSFRDEAPYKGRMVRFYKRAQILAADLFGAFGGRGWGRLSRVDALTAFADYRVPQILRHYGVLRYTPALAERVDARVELAAGSPEEVEIRANMIWAVEQIRARLARLGAATPSYRIDWLLWSKSRLAHDAKPHHRTRTVYY
mgnify:CR=1 FL=1